MSVPVEYVSILEKLVVKFDVSDQDLTADIQALKENTQGKSVPDKTYVDLLSRLYIITGDHRISFEFGKQIGSDALGFFGYAIRAVKNLEQAIQFEEKYMPVIYNPLKMKLTKINNDKFSIGMDYNAPKAFTPFLTEMCTCSFVQAFSDLAGRKNKHLVEESFKEFELRVNYAAPDYEETYYEYIPFKISFSQPFNEIIGPQKLLYSRNRKYDPTFHKLMVDQFDERLDKNYSEGLSDKVKNLLKENSLNTLSIEQISDQLNMSERTLRRKLQQEKTSFRDILLDTRMEESRSLIKQGKLSLEQISYSLGYQNPPTFSNAFKKKYGISPKQYKDSLD